MDITSAAAEKPLLSYLLTGSESEALYAHACLSCVPGSRCACRICVLVTKAVRSANLESVLRAQTAR
jgi:hypothetical protein